MEEKPARIIYKNRRYHLNRGYYKTTISLHQVIWEEFNGPVPQDHHIHHKNGDSTDNRLENLECIHKKKHHSIHFSAIRQLEKMHSKESRLKALESARSERGRELRGLAGKKEWAKRLPIERICVICDAKFKTKNLNGTKYCSQVCRSRCQSLRETIHKSCIICGGTFKTRNYSQASKTCSQSCKGRLISKTKLERSNDPVPAT